MKRMIDDYWIVSILKIKFGFNIIETLRTFIGKGIVNDYWIVCVFVIVGVFGI